MKIKIKCTPEDFVVEEKTNLHFNKKGDYAFYLLEKKEWNTLTLLQELSRRCRVPLADWSYGGRKDRHALTRQFVSLKSRKKMEPVREKDYSLEFCGFMDQPMSPDLIDFNRFEIVVRNLTAEQVAWAQRQVPAVQKHASPNYFDDQRFGSFDADQGFLAEKILKGHYNGAVKIYLTGRRDEDSPLDIKYKQQLFENWKKWPACCELARSVHEKHIFYHLKRNPADFVGAFKMIPRYELSLAISAYQAFLWNDMVRELVQSYTDGGLAYEGTAGSYCFYSEASDDAQSWFESLMIPTVSAQAQCEDPTLQKTFLNVMNTNGINYSLFNKIKIRQAFFKSSTRSMLMRLDHLTAESQADERYPDTQKLILKFDLGQGSYGTMLIKRLFADGLPR